jgi:two-component system, NarL family, sensor histidine kinase DesK
MAGLLPKNRDHGWAPYVWLVFLSFFFFQPVLTHAGAREWLITGGASLVFVVLYFGVFWTKPPITYVLLIAMAGMGIGLANFNPGSCVFIIFCSSFIPWVAGTTRRAVLALAVLILVLALDALFLHAPPSFWATSMVVALGVAGSNIHFAEKNRVDTKLRMAQDEIEHLAKVAERERIARDLHDVLGHTLSLIIVKSTLASKLLDRSGTQGSVTFDPQRAKAEINDIERVSREAMAEIRSTLRGYTTYKINDEVQRAESTLNTAGIWAESNVVEVSMSPAQESVVALILREAVTNVVRHSRARTCKVKLAAENGRCVLNVEDDGHGGTHTEGNGLRGMRERIEALGGTLVRNTTAGTRLKFEFPLNPAENGKH